MDTLDNDERFFRHKIDVSDALSTDLLHGFEGLCNDIHHYLINNFRVFVHW